MAERVLVDMNVALDEVLEREPFVKEADAIIQAHEDGGITAYIAAFTVPTIFYILSREFRRKYSQQDAMRQALIGVQVCLSSFAICPVDRAMIEEAVKMPGSDFEDNLQLACAHVAGLDAIVTRDAGISDPTLEILTPTQLLKQIK